MHLQGLPNRAGLARYLEKKPQVEAGVCFQGGHALGVRRETGSEQEEGWPFLLLHRSRQAEPTQCQQEGQLLACLSNHSWGAVKFPKGKDRVLFSLINNVPGTYRKLGNSHRMTQN